jgi:hypothetical protein
MFDKFPRNMPSKNAYSPIFRGKIDPLRFLAPVKNRLVAKVKFVNETQPPLVLLEEMIDARV